MLCSTEMSFTTHSIWGTSISRRGPRARPYSGWSAKRRHSLAKEAGDESDEFLELKKLVSQKYIGNFSLFQSVPDMWGVEQIFPTIPLHRLDEMPSERGRIVDITCDSDGEIKKYAGDSEGLEYLEMHTLLENRGLLSGNLPLGSLSGYSGRLP